MERKYLDFKSIRQRVPFLDVLARYNVEVRKVSHVQFKAKCPLPSHSNAKETDTFCVNVDKNIFICHSSSCQKAGNGSKGNLLDFVRLMDGVQAYEAAAKLDSWYPEGSSSSSLTTEQKTNSSASNGQPASSSNSLTNHRDATIVNQSKSDCQLIVNHPLAFRLKDVNPEHNLIQSRGISIETARKFGVGHFSGKGSMAGRIVFELRENGEVVGYAGRLVGEPTPENPKWKMPKGFVKHLYGLEFCDTAKPVVVVESPWAVLFLHQNGAQAVALLGSDMTPRQEQELAPFKVVTVALDNDSVGIEKAAAIVERLRAAGHKVFKARLME